MVWDVEDEDGTQRGLKYQQFLLPFPYTICEPLASQMQSGTIEVGRR